MFMYIQTTAMNACWSVTERSTHTDVCCDSEETEQEAETEEQTEESTEETAEEGDFPIRHLRMPDGTVLEIDGNGYVVSNSAAAAANSVRRLAPAARVKVTLKDNAWISAEYLDFQCKDTAGTPLNTEARERLMKEYSREAIPSGHIWETAPEMIEKKLDGSSEPATHVFSQATVLGVNIHEVGLLSIGGTEYVYYTIREDDDPDTVFAVLGEETKIILEYEHTQGQLLNYDVKMKDGSSDLPEGVSKDTVFGTHRANATAEDGSVSFQVTIPRGYTASVSVEEVNTPILIRFQDGQTEPKTQLELGVMKAYDAQLNLSSPKESDGKTDRLSKLILVPRGTRQHALSINVTLSRIESISFTADGWLETDHAESDRRDFDIPKDNSGYRPENYHAEPLFTTSPNMGEEESFAWKIRGKGSLDEFGKPYTWALDQLAINGETVAVPMIADQENGSAAGYVSNPVSEETTLSTGTRVKLTVQGYWQKDPNIERYYFYREYTLEVFNCAEDLTVTAGNFVNNSHKELVLNRLEGVSDVQAWMHADSSSAQWTDLDSSGSILLNRQNNQYNANWYSDPIRFRREKGYGVPHIVVKTTSGKILQRDGTLEEDGKSEFRKYGINPTIAVELVMPSGVQLDGENHKPTLTSYDYDQASKVSGVLTGENYNNIFADNNFKSTNNTYSWDYNTWSTDPRCTSPGSEGYYYIRGSKELYQYMHKNNANGQILIEITAQPIKAAIAYQDGASQPSGAPSKVSNMPPRDNNTQNGVDVGYGIEHPSAMISNQVPYDDSDGEEKRYVFQCWELLAVENGEVQSEVAKDKDGKDITFSNNESIDLMEALTENSPMINNYYMDEDGFAVFTLRARWMEAEEGVATTYNVEYYLVNKEDQLENDGKPIYEAVFGVPFNGKVKADIYKEDGTTLSDQVIDIIQSYTKNTDQSNYRVYEGKKYQNIPEIEEVSLANNTIKIYLTEVDPVSNITVSVDWMEEREGTITDLSPSLYPASTWVVLRRGLKAENNETVWEKDPVGDPVELTADMDWKYTWYNQYLSNADGKRYQYKVEECSKSGDPAVSTINLDNKMFQVKYGETKEPSSDENGNLSWSVSITNTYQVLKKPGSLKITKKFPYGTADRSAAAEKSLFRLFGMKNDSAAPLSTITITLTLPDIPSWGEKPEGGAYTQEDITARWEEISGVSVSGNSDKITVTWEVTELEDKAASITLYNVPENTQYAVEEKEASSSGYTVTYKNGEDEVESILGSIEADQTSEVTVINSLLGEVTITKRIGETNRKWTHADTSFTIHVVLDNPSELGIGNDVTRISYPTSSGRNISFNKDTGGEERNRFVATWPFKEGGSLTIQEIPNGARLEVHEHLNQTGYTSQVQADGKPLDDGDTFKVQGGRESSVTVTNTRQPASLTLTNKVEGNGAEKEKTFEYVVTFGKGSLDGENTPDVIWKKNGNNNIDITVTNENGDSITSLDSIVTPKGNGAFQVRLKHGQSITFGSKENPLPAGFSYDIKATGDADYVTRYQKDSGQPETGLNVSGMLAGNHQVTYTHERQQGKLRIQKNVTGDRKDTTKNFEFTVILKKNGKKFEYSAATDVRDSQGKTVKFKDGTAVFTLNGESKNQITFTLPAGIEYCVTEADYRKDGYETSYGTDGAKACTGTIPSQGKEEVAVITNTRGEPQPGTLVITNVLDGDGVNEQDTFTFQVTLADESFQKKIETELGTVSFEKGKAEIVMTGSGKVTLKDLPAVSYGVEQLEAPGYLTTQEGAQGAIPENGVATATFTNKKQMTPPEQPDPGQGPGEQPGQEDHPSGTEGTGSSGQDSGNQSSGSQMVQGSSTEDGGNTIEGVLPVLPQVQPDADAGTGDPATGDESHMMLWITLLAVSVLVIAGTLFFSRKELYVKNIQRKKLRKRRKKKR